MENLNTDEKVLVLAERIKKKNQRLESFASNLYFNKERTFSIRKKKKLDKIDYYWLKNLETNKNLTKKFQRTKLFAIKNNFSM